MRDLMNNITPRVAIAPTVVTDNTALVGALINRQGYDSLTYLIETGTLADVDATFAVTMTHGDASDGSDLAAVASTDLVGTLALAGFTFANDGACFKVGYIGSKQYTKLTITPTSNSGNAPIGAIALLGHPNIRPTANPPV